MRLIHQEPLLFGKNEFTRVEIVSIIKEVFNTTISVNYVSQQKLRPFLRHSVQRTVKTVGYCKKLVEMYSDLDTEMFLTKIRGKRKGKGKDDGSSNPDTDTDTKTKTKTTTKPITTTVPGSEKVPGPEMSPGSGLELDLDLILDRERERDAWVVARDLALLSSNEYSL